MHILVVNDDGPPSEHASPYVHTLVRALQAAGHLVSVCLPHTQRSWIGKAHMIGQTVEPQYYRPPPPDAPPAGLARLAGEPANEGSVYARPYAAAGGSPDSAAAAAAAAPPPEEWVLVNGTPASCVQIGLYHVFRARPPVDLVVSGPNYGRNTTAVFALSSGTLGGALEAATCRRRAVALSYAFFSRNHDRAIVAEASRHAVRVIEALAARWPADGSVDLYSVNVPLVAGVAAAKTVYAGVLQNYWRAGGCFVADDGDGAAGGDAAAAEEERLRAAEATEDPPAGGSSAGTADKTPYHGHDRPLQHRSYKWQPRFTDIYNSVDEAPPGNDGWAVREGMTSITPLKANFWPAATELHQTEFPLEDPRPDNGTLADRSAAKPETITTTATPPPTIYALVAYDDPYVQPLVLNALRAVVPPDRLRLLSAPAATTADEPVALEELLAGLSVDAGGPSSGPAQPHAAVLQITPYEAIDFAYAAAAAAGAPSLPAAPPVWINSYMIRKALIRKHFLAATVEQWVAKRPASVLKRHVQRAEAFEVDYAEFLDDALVEAFDLRASLEANETRAPGGGGGGGGGADRRTWWILKPSMSDRGQGIRLFSTMDELQAIFDGWEEDFEEEEEEEEEEGNETAPPKDYVAASHLRHFVAQPYLHPPLLLPGTGGRKFHIRVYVLCVGALQVYVYRDMLALFAAKPYAAPWDDDDSPDLAAHLTNTCLQDDLDKGRAVQRFWDLAEPADNGGGGGGGGGSSGGGSGSSGGGSGSSSSGSLKDAVFDQICRVTGELFEAAAVAAPIHFQPLAHAFEVYGLDFLVTAADSRRTDGDDAAPATAWLLEVNAFPDFRQTGAGLQTLVARFWTDALRLVVRRMGGGAEEETDADRGQMVLVKDLDLGRR